MEQKQRRQQVRDYLGQYRILRAEERGILGEIDRLRQRMDLSAVRLTGMPKGGKPYLLDDYIVDLEELESRLDTSILEGAVTYMAIEKRIEEMDDPLHRTVLRGRYLAGQSLDQLAGDLGYSPSRLYHIFGEALDAFPLPGE